MVVVLCGVLIYTPNFSIIQGDNQANTINTPHNTTTIRPSTTVSIPHNISHVTHGLYDNGNVNTTTKQITLYLPRVNPHYTKMRRITS